MGALNHDITEFLDSWVAGDEGALEKLTPLVYRELHRLAAHYMRREQPDHTLQTTALVNESYVRLLDWNKVQFQNRGHFFGVMARLMRQILVDYARSGRCDKRGGGVRPIVLDESQPVRDNRLMVLVEIDEALNRLAIIDAQRARVVELRYFGGLSVEETAQILQVAPITVRRHWNFAKAWLLRELAGTTTRES
jgi:RNA polymerase sigma factor (TIGR02999 family)